MLAAELYVAGGDPAYGDQGIEISVRQCMKAAYDMQAFITSFTPFRARQPVVSVDAIWRMRDHASVSSDYVKVAPLPTTILNWMLNRRAKQKNLRR